MRERSEVDIEAFVHPAIALAHELRGGGSRAAETTHAGEGVEGAVAAAAGACGVGRGGGGVGGEEAVGAVREDGGVLAPGAGRGAGFPAFEAEFGGAVGEVGGGGAGVVEEVPAVGAGLEGDVEAGDAHYGGLEMKFV